MRTIFFLQSVLKISSYLASIVIHMKFASSVKLNKSQIMVELRSALGQYPQRVICYGLPLTYRLSLLPYFCSLVLRKFDSWNPSSDVTPGQPEYYQKQVYNHGTRCWNGPERSVIVSLHIPFPPLILPGHIYFIADFSLINAYPNSWSWHVVLRTPSSRFKNWKNVNIKLPERPRPSAYL